ncbi:MAG: hypothetical protein EB127_14415, partial [Alphaproteobacteria bacterium]|nr:hypothetical protein [Alphaproteobacteria bacterium]
MASNESKHGDHAFAIGGFSPFTLGHQAVAREMQKNHHASVNLYTTKATTRPIPADKKVEYIKKAVAPSTHVGATVTPLHALSDMHSRGLRGEVTFYGGSDRKPIADRLRQYNGKEGPHGYYKFDAIHFKQVGGERKEGASGLAGVSGTAARASKSPEELKKFIPKELHKHATEIFNHIQDKTSQKKPIRERYLNEELFNLFGSKIDVNLINYNGDTVLHNRILQPKFSVSKREIEKHQIILARMDSFYVNYPNIFYYETLMHLYARHEMWKDLEEELSKKYLDIYRENKDGYAPIDFVSQGDRKR